MMKLDALDNAIALPEWSVYATANAIVSNNLVPIREINGTWPQYHPSQGQNFALTIAQTQTGVQFRRWSLGVIDRVDWWASTNKDSADLIYRSKAKLGTDPGHSYVLDYQLTGFTAKGIQLGKTFEGIATKDWKLNWSSALSALQGSRYKNDEVSGFGKVSDTNQIMASVQRNDADSNLNVSPSHFNPFIPTGKPSGEGYSIDLAMKIVNSTGYRFDFTMGDAIGQMYWKAIPQIKTVANNINYTYDIYGNRNSTIAGVDSRGNITENIAPKTSINFTTPTPFGFFEIGDSHFHGVDFPEIGLGHQGQNWETVATYDTRTKSVGIVYAIKSFSFGLQSNTFHESEARTFGLSLSVHIPL